MSASTELTRLRYVVVHSYLGRGPRRLGIAITVEETRFSVASED